jgi:hypothetical protein
MCSLSHAAMGEVMELHRAAIVAPRADVVYGEVLQIA